MTTNQLFFALAGLMATFAGFFKYYLDAKIDPIREQVKSLIDYMVIHQGKIATLEEKTRKL
jgi:hypothetical protein